MALACVDVLLSIPESISCTVLSEWIDWKDLFKVDTAYCQRSARALLHELFKQLRLTSNQHIYSERYFSNTFMTWCISRKIKFMELSLAQRKLDSFDLLVIDWSQPDLTLIEDIEFHRTYARQISSFLSITGRTLRRFDCCSNFSAAWLGGLSLHATCLQEFCWNSNERVEGSVISQLLQHNQSTLFKLTLLTDEVHASITFDFLLPEVIELMVDLPHSVFGLLTSTPNLQCLTMNMANIPVFVLRALSGHSQLRSVTLDNIGQECAQELAAFIPAAGVALYLSFIEDVSDTDLKACLSHCTNVKLVNCALDSVSGSCFEKHGSTLQNLIIRYDDVDDIYLCTELTHCTALESFSLLNDDDVSVAYVLRLIRSLPASLRALTLNEVPDDPRIREAIARCLPHVVELNIEEFPAKEIVEDEETVEEEETDDDEETVEDEESIADEVIFEAAGNVIMHQETNSYMYTNVSNLLLHMHSGQGPPHFLSYPHVIYHNYGGDGVHHASNQLVEEGYDTMVFAPYEEDGITPNLSGYYPH